MAQSFGDPNYAATKLKQWGWKENVFTTFEIPAADATDPNATTYMNVSIHRFSNADGAAAAFTYFSDAVVAAQHMTDVTVDKIGDQTRELSVKSTDSNLAVVYIRSGNYLIRIGASSPTGNPSADILALAKKVVK